MALFFRELATFFRRLENSNNFQRNGNFFQILLIDCSGAIHPILGTFLLPIFRYPLPRPKMDFLIPAARSRSSRGPAKSAHFFSKPAKKFRTHTTFFRLLTQNFRTLALFFRQPTKNFRSNATIFRSYTTIFREHTLILRTNINECSAHLVINAAASCRPCSPATTV